MTRSKPWLLEQRHSGVLLHITSLPGPHGSGDLGADARHFIDWLVSAGQRLWQILPLSPTGPGNSPYHSPSTFAGNPLLVDLDDLVERGWLAGHTDPSLDSGHCDFVRVRSYRLARLQAAWQGFSQHASPADIDRFAAYCQSQSHWLEGYALFMALEARHGVPWTHWPTPLRQRNPQALAESAAQLADALGYHRFVQWCFHTQWHGLREYAHAHRVSIVGDAPIFVAHHSADVWMNTAQYFLDAQGEPTVVAGVPPDHFSATGQRWGNPLYRWDAMADDEFAWWSARIRHLLGLVDVVRLDHFRGFEAYWEIPAQQATAVTGHWHAGPGKALFDALAQVHSPRGGQRALPIIAEDLGDITPAVHALRKACGFPGMRVMQFAFGDGAANPYLPHNFDTRTVAYTGTHDNDTSVGWWRTASAHEKHNARAYLGPMADTEIHWAMAQSLSQSVANTVIFALQDVLGLDGAHRMNTPGLSQGCWQWRFGWQQVGPNAANRLRELTHAHGRNLPAADSTH
jgi:4-alpha-glucanotransferase